MTNVAWKNLVRERTRFSLSVGGVAFAVVLILILRGLYWGIAEEATAFIHTTPADLWVTQAGAPADFIQSMTIQPAPRRAAIAAVDGVDAVVPLLSRPVAFRANGKDTDIFLLGAEAGDAMGWPPAAVSQKLVPGPGQIVVDRVFAKNSGVRRGDVLHIQGHRLEVAGVVTGGNALVYQFGWANLSDVTRIADAGGTVSYFLVRTTGTAPEAVSRRIVREVPGTQVLTAADFATKNSAILREGFLPVLWVLVLIAIAVGTAVIGLIIYTATVEKSREYGVLKAIGFSNRRLYKVVFQQSLLAATAGFAVGAVLSVVLGPAIERVVPVFVTQIRWGDILFAGTGALAMAVVASFIPARPVTRLDPAEVFRA